ncbi:MAG: 4-hydroxy-tetrahydrodipicolinate synthase [Myxococcales bacterium]|nr:4-hydroxy-tetrahydrodipicolinate synthase [Myxococcales bacterium]
MRESTSLEDATAPSPPVTNVADRLQGAMSALVTPFNAVGDVDVPALTRMVEQQLSQGINGLIVCGTTGETPTLTVEERGLLVRTVVETVRGRVPVLAGTGTNATRTTIAETRAAAQWGVDAALVVCPYYNKPTQEGILHHFRAVARDGGLPVVAYNVPGRTSSDMLPPTVAKLAREGVIVGIKDATADMIRATEVRSMISESWPFALLSGDDFTILPFMACGGCGVISVVSNICPGDTARLVKLCLAQKYHEARVLHERIVRLSRALFSLSSPIPLKAALAEAGWCSAETRLPLMTANEETKAVVRQALLSYSGALCSPDADRSLENFMS